MITFTPRPLYPQGKCVASRNRCGYFREDTSFVQPISLVTVWTTLPQVHIYEHLRAGSSRRIKNVRNEEDNSHCSLSIAELTKLKGVRTILHVIFFQQLISSQYNRSICFARSPASTSRRSYNYFYFLFCMKWFRMSARRQNILTGFPRLATGHSDKRRYSAAN